MNDRSRPKAAPDTSFRGDTPRVAATTDIMPSSCPWAERVIAAGRARGVIPKYAGMAWLALPLDDPRRVAAVVIAAECWFHEGRPEVMAERLREQLEEADYLTARRVREASYDVSGAADWHKVANRRRPAVGAVR